jgi:hypothetical protein
LEEGLLSRHALSLRDGIGDLDEHGRAWTAQLTSRRETARLGLEVLEEQRRITTPTEETTNYYYL